MNAAWLIILHIIISHKQEKIYIVLAKQIEKVMLKSNTIWQEKGKKIHAITWTSLKNMLRTGMHYIYIQCPEKANLLRQKEISGNLGLGVGSEINGNGHERSFWDDVKHLNLTLFLLCLLLHYFSCKDREHEICTLSTFLNIQYSIVNYKHNTLQMICRTGLSENLYLLNSMTHFPLPIPAPGNHHSLFCFYELDKLRCLM